MERKSLPSEDDERGEEAKQAVEDSGKKEEVHTVQEGEKKQEVRDGKKDLCAMVKLEAPACDPEEEVSCCRERMLFVCFENQGRNQGKGSLSSNVMMVSSVF